MWCINLNVRLKDERYLPAGVDIMWFVTDKAPMSKSLLLVPTALTVLLTLFLPQYQSLFEYNLQALREEHQVSITGLSPRG